VLDGWSIHPKTYKNTWNRTGENFSSFLKRQSANLGRLLRICNTRLKPCGRLHTIPTSDGWDLKYKGETVIPSVKQELLGIIVGACQNRQELIVLVNGNYLLVEDANDNELIDFRII